MTRLLDGNILIALVLKFHPGHERCARWLENMLATGSPIATCPVTEGTLLRMHMQLSASSSPSDAWAALEGIAALSIHEFWPDSFSYREVPHDHLQGYKQVTDAWLVELARRRQGKLATLDAALATLHPDVVELVPVIL